MSTLISATLANGEIVSGEVLSQPATITGTVLVQPTTLQASLTRTIPGPAGPVGVNWVGSWDNATSFGQRDGVTHNGSSYVAMVANTNVEPGTAPATWLMIAQKGEDGLDGDDLDWAGDWDNTVTYQPNNGVRHNGGSWRSLVANTNVEPGTAPATWTTIAEKGDTGPSGSFTLVGSGPPGGGTGTDGDMYVDDLTGNLYGPKAAGAWGAVVFRLVTPAHGSVILIAADTDVTVADDPDPFWVADQNADGTSWDSIVVDITGTPGVGGASTFMLRRVRASVSTDLLSTGITVDDGELASDAAGTTPPVFAVAETGIQTGDRFYLDRDGISTTAPKGLGVRFTTKL